MTPTTSQIEPIASDAVETDALRGWYLARQAAKRYNRNLLQYGAGLAAVIGINAGTGGMLALADSLSLRSAVAIGGEVDETVEPAFWPLSSLADWMIAATTAAAVVLLVLLVRAYRDRQRAERRADAYVERLITMSPKWFRPDEE